MHYPIIIHPIILCITYICPLVWPLVFGYFRGLRKVERIIDGPDTVTDGVTFVNETEDEWYSPGRGFGRWVNFYEIQNKDFRGIIGTDEYYIGHRNRVRYRKSNPYCVAFDKVWDMKAIDSDDYSDRWRKHLAVYEKYRLIFVLFRFAFAMICIKTMFFMSPVDEEFMETVLLVGSIFGSIYAMFYLIGRMFGTSRRIYKLLPSERYARHTTFYHLNHLGSYKWKKTTAYTKRPKSMPVNKKRKKRKR